MFARFVRHVRQQFVGYIALFIALGGVSYAAVTLPKNSVGSKQIAKGAVKASDLGKNAVNSAKVKDGSLKPQDFAAGAITDSSSTPGPQGPQGEKGETGPQGEKGETGPSTGPAGGDLAGNYPNPTLRASEAKIPAFPASGIPGCGSGYFSNYGNGTNSAGYYKDRAGIVHIEGVVKPSTSVSGPCGGIFVLPAGYRPGATMFVPVLRSGAAAGVAITSAGVVSAEGSTLSSDWVTLDNISFRAEG